jgi:cytochrome c oxidase subunit 1
MGLVLMGIATIFFLGIALYTACFGRRVGADYWENIPATKTLEWHLPSPPPFHQFDIQPSVK